MRARALAGIFLLALLARLTALVELRGTPWNDVLLGDSSYFHAWGSSIAAGTARGDQPFFQAPLYPYVLGGIFALFGNALTLVRVLQSVLGALAAVLVAAGTRRFASERAGWIAGALAALYAPAVWYDLQIEKTSLTTSISAALFFLMVTRDPRRRIGTALAAGIALGALVLLRQNAAVLALPVGAAFLGPGDRPRGRTLAALGIGAALFLVPVARHNLAAGDVPLPTTSNAGVNFYIGNGAQANGLYRPLVAGRAHPDYESEDATRIAEGAAAGRRLSPAEVSRYWFTRTARDIAADPGRLARLMARKVRLLLHRGEIMDVAAFEVFQDESRVLRTLAPFSFGLLLPLALAGMVLAARRPGAGLAIVSAGLLALSILAFFMVGRFRLGLAPFLIPFAAVTLDEAHAVLRRPAALLLLAIGLLGAWWPLDLGGNPRADSASNLASELLRREDYPGAERWARAALAREPGLAEASFNLGIALQNQGKHAAAREPFLAAMRLEPAYAADSLAELGAIAAALGDPAGARTLLERAIKLESGHAAARHYLQLLGGPFAPATPGAR